MDRQFSRPRLKRAAIQLLQRSMWEITVPEQRLVLQMLKTAIREIGSKQHDSTRFFYTPLFRVYIEGLGVDADAFRAQLIDIGLLPAMEGRVAA